IAGSVLGAKVQSVGAGLHVAGTACLGAGIYLAGQIFNLQEHWPGGLMLWSLGAVIAWLILRQWPQALLAAGLLPCWLSGEWYVATEGYRGSWNIAAQGLLLLCILYFSVRPRGSNRHLLVGMVWAGSIALIPLLADVIFSGDSHGWYYSFLRQPVMP